MSAKLRCRDTNEVLEDAKMASFVIANFCYPLVRSIKKTEVGEDGLVERCDEPTPARRTVVFPHTSYHGVAVMVIATARPFEAY